MLDRMMSKFLVICNSGAKTARLIKCYSRPVPEIGDKVLVSILTTSSNSKISKHTICKAVVVHTKKPYQRLDGSLISMENNCIVLLNKETELPLGTRILGPIPQEIGLRYGKILSLSEGTC